MIIPQTGAYIVKVRNTAGEQYAHMVLQAGYDTDSHPMIEAVICYAQDGDAIKAWGAHRAWKSKGDPIPDTPIQA